MSAEAVTPRLPSIVTCDAVGWPNLKRRRFVIGWPRTERDCAARATAGSDLGARRAIPGVDPTQIPLLRIRLEPESGSGLVHTSSSMVDQLTTMPRCKLGRHIGGVSDTHTLALLRALVVFLGLA